MAETTANPASHSQLAIAPAQRAANSATAKAPKASDRRKNSGWAKDGSGSPEIQAAKLCKPKPTATAPINISGGIRKDGQDPPIPKRRRPAQAIRKNTVRHRPSDQ